MSPSIARVSVKGQLTIPKDVRKTLSISTGDDVLFEEKHGEVVIRKIPATEAPWSRSVQTTLSEWDDGLDDDL